MRRVSLLITLFTLLILASITSAADSKPAWQRDWEKILDGAKKEGEVRLWGDQEITHPDILAAFNRAASTASARKSKTARAIRLNMSTKTG